MMYPQVLVLSLDAKAFEILLHTSIFSQLPLQKVMRMERDVNMMLILLSLLAAAFVCRVSLDK